MEKLIPPHELTSSSGSDGMRKVRLATEWFATCAGCEIALLDLGEKLVELFERCELVYSPLVDVKELPEDLDLTLVSGAIRNEEEREQAKKLRENSKTLIAFGSCACFGGVPGLANLVENQGLFERIFVKTRTTVNPKGVLPTEEVPAFEDRVYALSQVVRVDYCLPGCPPPTDLIAEVLFGLLDGKKPELPRKNLCDECPFEREEKRIERVRRPIEGIPDPTKCMLDQGYICLGPATRAGCGAACLKVGIPCRGCLGPTDEILEQGAKMISAIASVLEVDEQEVARAVYDPLGMFYRFSLPTSIIQRRVKRDAKGHD